MVSTSRTSAPPSSRPFTCSAYASTSSSNATHTHTHTRVMESRTCALGSELVLKHAVSLTDVPVVGSLHRRRHWQRFIGGTHGSCYKPLTTCQQQQHQRHPTIHTHTHYDQRRTSVWPVCAETSSAALLASSADALFSRYAWNITTITVHWTINKSVITSVKLMNEIKLSPAPPCHSRPERCWCC